MKSHGLLFFAQLLRPYVIMSSNASVVSPQPHYKDLIFLRDEEPLKSPQWPWQRRHSCYNTNISMLEARQRKVLDILAEGHRTP
jgi:hypothetical protein